MYQNSLFEEITLAIAICGRGKSLYLCIMIYFLVMLLPVGRVRENAEKQTDSKIGIRQQEYLRGIYLVPIL